MSEGEREFDSDDPSFWTYYTVSWASLAQEPTEDVCVTCGGNLLRVGPIRNKPGAEFEGRVCHNCKVVLWVRTGAG